MCGIVGFYSNNKTEEQKDFLYKLMFQSKIRGLHSFGFAYYKEKGIVTEKFFKLPLITCLNGFFSSDSKVLIYHNRYSTSGDYHDMNNNQPITIEDMSVAVNGNISMKEKAEFEKDFNVNCITGNDSEILLHKIKENKVEELLKAGGVTLAGVCLFNGNLYAIRNNSRPLYRFDYLGASFVCSTVDIAFRAGFKEVLKPITPFVLEKINV